MQQTIFYVVDYNMNGWLNLAVAGSITVVLGVASWHIEPPLKPALLPRWAVLPSPDLLHLWSGAGRGQVL